MQLCRVTYGYVGLFIRSAMLVACNAFKVDSGYHSKSSEPFVQIVA